MDTNQIDIFSDGGEALVPESALGFEVEAEGEEEAKVGVAGIRVVVEEGGEDVVDMVPEIESVPHHELVEVELIKAHLSLKDMTFDVVQEGLMKVEKSWNVLDYEQGILADRHVKGLVVG